MSLLAACIFLVFVFFPSSASAFPPYDGLMTFRAIQDPLGPEEFSWELDLGEDQGLELIDDQHAQVYYVEGHLPALGISAHPAHDADGSVVPTTLGISEGDVITLTVHHRAGDPASGTPFDYPVIAGAGWDGGVPTFPGVIRPNEQQLREEGERRAREEREAAEGREALKACLVPRLKGGSLKASARRLRDAGCKLGKVHGERSSPARVVRQGVVPGTVLPAGTQVSVKLAS